MISSEPQAPARRDWKIADLIIPDIIPLVHEILIGLVTAMLARCRKKNGKDDDERRRRRRTGATPWLNEPRCAESKEAPDSTQWVTVMKISGERTQMLVNDLWSGNDSTLDRLLCSPTDTSVPYFCRCVDRWSWGDDFEFEDVLVAGDS